MGVATDLLFNVYVADQANHRIQVFRHDGKFLNHWTFSQNVCFLGKNEVSMIPKSVSVGMERDGSAAIYVTSWDDVLIFQLDGKFIKSLGGCCVLPARFDPSCTTFDADGCLYVSDHENCRIHVFNHSGLFRSWGEPREYTERKRGHFWKPIGIALGPDRLLYVCDTYNDRVQLFQTKGDHERQLVTTEFAASHHHLMKSPHSLSFDPSGRLFVCTEPNLLIFE